MNKILIAILFSLISIFANAQKGTSEYLETHCGIFPIMLNDLLTKNIKILTPIGKAEENNILCQLDEDYCLINTANLLSVNIRFINKKATNILFFVNPVFKMDCLNELEKMYGKSKKDGDKYTWESKNYMLVYDLNPSDYPGKSLGIFFRKIDLGKSK